MIYKAKVNFSGIVSMNAGDKAEISDAAIVKDLLKAGYIEECKPAEKVTKAKATSNKKTTSRKRG